MSCQRTVLRERNVAELAPEAPQVDVPLVMHDQICALVECFMALRAIRANKLALKVRHAESRTLILDPDLLVGILGQNFKACIVSTFRNDRLAYAYGHWRAPWATSFVCPSFSAE